MNINLALEKKISQKKKEIKELDEKIRVLNAEKRVKQGEITGLEEALKLMPKESSESSFKKDVASMRKDSTVTYAYDVLQKAKNAMHVDDILEQMGGGTKDDKHALASQLNYNSRNDRIFRKTAPNTFELLFWDVPLPSSLNNEQEQGITEDHNGGFSLPDDFDSDEGMDL